MLQVKNARQVEDIFNSNKWRHLWEVSMLKYSFHFELDVEPFSFCLELEVRQWETISCGIQLVQQSPGWPLPQKLFARVLKDSRWSRKGEWNPFLLKLSC